MMSKGLILVVGIGCGGVAAQVSTGDFPLVRVIDNALPVPVLDALERDAPLLSPRSLWVGLPQHGVAQSAIGRAVSLLYDQAFPKGGVFPVRSNAAGAWEMAGAEQDAAAGEVTSVPGHIVMQARARVVGAEVWVLTKGANASHAPHFDKDERLAFATGRMAFPLLGTVTYFGETGGPTLVLDQVVGEDQAELTPAVPVQGGLVWPRRNRHLLFRGDCYHTVLGGLAREQQQQQQQQEVAGDAEGGAKAAKRPLRVTFLLNWWARKLEPGGTLAFHFDDQWAESNDLTLLPDDEGGGGRGGRAARRPAGNADAVERYVGLLPPSALRAGARSAVQHLPLFRTRNESSYTGFHFGLPRGDERLLDGASMPGGFRVRWRQLGARERGSGGGGGGGGGGGEAASGRGGGGGSSSSSSSSMATATATATATVGGVDVTLAPLVGGDGGASDGGASDGGAGWESWVSPPQLHAEALGCDVASRGAAAATPAACSRERNLRALLSGGDGSDGGGGSDGEVACTGGVPLSVIFLRAEPRGNGSGSGAPHHQATVTWSPRMENVTRALAPLVAAYEGKLRVFSHICAHAPSPSTEQLAGAGAALAELLGGVGLGGECERLASAGAWGSAVAFVGGRRCKLARRSLDLTGVSDGTAAIDELWHSFLVEYFTSSSSSSEPPLATAVLATEEDLALAAATGAAAHSYEDAFRNML
jgi:hypothetical protein